MKNEVELLDLKPGEKPTRRPIRVFFLDLNKDVYKVLRMFNMFRHEGWANQSDLTVAQGLACHLGANWKWCYRKRHLKELNND